MSKHFNGKRQAVYSFAERAFSAIDVHKESKKSGMISVVSGGDMVIDHPEIKTASDLPGASHIPLDFHSWLPFSAPVYQISPDPNDYILVPVIAMPSDLPNRNGAAFPLRELVRFNPEMGMQAYKTWKGKPTHLEHANEDITKAYGVIADSFMKPLIGWSDSKIWKLMFLLAFDRSKHADVADKIASGEYNSYSMGAWVGGHTCSYCNAEVGKCNHLRKNKAGQMYELNGKMVFSNCHDIIGFECSSVGTPAFISAISDTKLSFSAERLTT